MNCLPARLSGTSQGEATSQASIGDAERIKGFFRRLDERAGGTLATHLVDVMATERYGVVIEEPSVERAGKTYGWREVVVFSFEPGGHSGGPGLHRRSDRHRVVLVPGSPRRAVGNCLSLRKTGVADGRYRGGLSSRTPQGVGRRTHLRLPRRRHQRYHHRPPAPERAGR